MTVRAEYQPGLKLMIDSELFLMRSTVFDATGVRLRSVPFKREKVKAALQSA